jgi:RNase P/RNase MRP subunit POP5
LARYIVIETLDDVNAVYREIEETARSIAGINWLRCGMELKATYKNRLIIRTRTKCVKWVRAAIASLRNAAITLRVTGSMRKAEALALSLRPLYIDKMNGDPRPF